MTEAEMRPVIVIDVDGSEPTRQRCNGPSQNSRTNPC